MKQNSDGKYLYWVIWWVIDLSILVNLACKLNSTEEINTCGKQQAMQDQQGQTSHSGNEIEATLVYYTQVHTNSCAHVLLIITV